MTDPNSSPSDAGVAAWVAGMLQATDTFYPTGGYAHSFGLEGLVQAGVVREAATLEMFLRESVLPSLRQVELPLAAHAWRALEVPDWAEVGALCRLSSALRAPRELRQASDAIGRQRVEVLARLRPGTLAAAYAEESARAAWPGSAAVAAALEGRVLGAPLPAVLAGLAYTAIAATIAAAMKLLRLGQNGAQQLLTASLAEVPALVAAALLVSRDEIGWFNPWLDIAAARHESAPARMFIS